MKGPDSVLDTSSSAEFVTETLAGSSLLTRYLTFTRVPQTRLLYQK